MRGPHSPAITMPTPRFPLVIFDLDGTLVDSAADIAEAVNLTLAGYGLATVSEATVRSWIGDGVSALLDTALHHAGSDLAPEQAMPAFMRHYGEALLRAPRLYDGVDDVLSALSARGATLAICTNKPERFVAPLLAHMGIAHHFAALVGGDSLPERKPAALPLLHLARRFGHAVDECLMVGDSATDAAAAQAAAMPLVLVRHGYARGFDLDRAGALAVIDDMPALLDHIDGNDAQTPR